MPVTPLFHGWRIGSAGSVDDMSVDRPQFGEYASPEEQRVRAGLPPLEQVPVAQAPALAQDSPAVPRAYAARAPQRAGRLITPILLGIGLVNVLTSIPSFMNLASTLDQSLKMLGVEGTFSNFAAARTWGIISVAVLLIGYALTLWLSVRRIRQAKSSWWVPLVGFVATMIVVTICISVPMFGDPAFTQSVMTPPGG